MPLREYVCRRCRSRREVLETLAGTEVQRCCKRRMERQVSVPGAPQFKGKGFYATDYKRKG